MRFFVRSGSFFWNKKTGWRSAIRQASRMTLDEANVTAHGSHARVLPAPTVAERRAIRAYLRAAQNGAPFTRPGGPHHEVFLELERVGLAAATRADGKWFWSLQEAARKAA